MTAQTCDSKQLRRALGSFATGVTVVTARDRRNDELVGITVNSFASVSLAPPLVSWALRLESRNLSVFAIGVPFAINMLSDDQRALCARFARTDCKFEGVRYRLNDLGIPLLAGCVGSIECRVAEKYCAGDHTIIIGRAERWDIDNARAPLIVYRGSYLARSASSATSG